MAGGQGLDKDEEYGQGCSQKTITGPQNIENLCIPLSTFAIWTLYAVPW